MGKDRQTMDKKELQAFAKEVAESIKTEAHLNEFRQDKQVINKSVYLALVVNMEGLQAGHC
jgi:hypothetical protein